MTDMMRMRYDANKRSTGLAYVLWFFLGWFGIHRFYLNRIPSGIVMLVIGVVSVPLTAILIGYIGLAIIGLWWCIDVFLIPGMTEAYNNRLIASLQAA